MNLCHKKEIALSRDEFNIEKVFPTLYFIYLINEEQELGRNIEPVFMEKD